MLPFKTLIPIDPNSKPAVYEQIALALIQLVKSGKLQSGMRLPSTRTMAALLGVHRKTIVAAYEILTIQGWVSTKYKSGYFVSTDIQVAAVNGQAMSETTFAGRFPLTLKTVDKGKARQVEQSGQLFLDDGLPDPRIAPYKELLRELGSITERQHNLQKANYGTAFNASGLSTALLTHLSHSRGLNLSEGNILITNGAQMGLYLVARVLAQQGDLFIVGTPGYDLGRSAFLLNGAAVIDVAVDENGIDVDQIAEICRTTRVKGVYVIPHHHYPTTVALSPRRRLQLLSLARQYNFILIEDDYDYDFHYSSAPHLPMASYDHRGRVIYVGSISKHFSSSLRLGYVVGTQDLIRSLAHIRKHMDIRGDVLLEQAVAELFNSGAMERHLRRSIKLYRERRDYLCAKLTAYSGHYLSFRVPAGGMAIWIRFGDDYDVRSVAAQLRKRGVAFDERIVFADAPHLNHLRLGFSSLDLDAIDFLVEVLGQVLENYPVQ
ncbi:PLP-dependent aminotransferase family protein [Sphingobacterium thalpophilum]|uniref:aminotransferase-like domain-containing protein n=1 Tax=Sphingobacterium thalpophilum TaxID=259 RepID=UPI0024A75652|nr:PLP-dependent aminotransferase family protein [Sphingobacterium thalpophilum]